MIHDSDNTNFDILVRKFIEVYKDGYEDPLDGDEVDRITQIFNCKANFQQGNITYDEYLELLDKEATMLYTRRGEHQKTTTRFEL